jgi:hypothetical protein
MTVGLNNADLREEVEAFTDYRDYRRCLKPTVGVNPKDLLSGGIDNAPSWKRLIFGPRNCAGEATRPKPRYAKAAPLFPHVVMSARMSHHLAIGFTARERFTIHHEHGMTAISRHAPEYAHVRRASVGSLGQADTGAQLGRA